MAHKKIKVIDETEEFVPKRRAVNSSNKSKTETARPRWIRRHKWLILIVCFVVMAAIIFGAAMKIRADVSAKNYHQNALLYLQSADAVVAASSSPHMAAESFSKVAFPHFEKVFLAEKYSEQYRHALADKKYVEAIRGRVSAQLVEYSLLADFEDTYQTKLAGIAELHDNEPVSIDDAGEWATHYRTEVIAMEKIVKDSQVPSEVQPAKADLKKALASASAALGDVVAAVEVGRVETYNTAFEKLTIAENAAADAYSRIQTIEPSATQAAILTDIAETKNKL